MHLSPRVGQRRRGRILIESLVALAVVGVAGAGILDLSARALGAADSALQHDIAAQLTWAAAAEALRAPCAPLAPEVSEHGRHRLERTVAGFATRTVSIRDRWTTVGVGQHVAHEALAAIGVRCE